MQSLDEAKSSVVDYELKVLGVRRLEISSAFLYSQNYSRSYHGAYHPTIVVMGKRADFKKNSLGGASSQAILSVH